MTADLRALLAKATEGPWRAVPADNYEIAAAAYPASYPHRFPGDDTGSALAVFGNWPADFGEANRNLVVAAVNALPALLGEIEALKGERDEAVADAERWRAFISSERFYAMGAAGFTWEPPAVDPERDKDNWLHFTLNVWDKHPAGDDAQGRHGRALLLAYVEHLRATALSQSPTKGDAS